MAMAHNILKVAGIRQLLSENNPGKKDKQVENRDSVSPLACIFHTILDTFQTGSKVYCLSLSFFSAASTVCLRSMEIVTGPTPPGTGVMADAFS